MKSCSSARVLLLLLGFGSAPFIGSPQASAAAKAKKKVAPAESSDPAPTPALASPLEQLKKTNVDLKRLLQKPKPSWSPEADLKNKDTKKLVDALLDFDELGKRALAKHWDKVKPAERAEFVTTLRELVERNYLKQMYGQPDYEMKFVEEKIEGDEAGVTSTLTAKRKGKKVEMSIDYKLVRKDGRWVVYDIITDDLSLLENYRAEFNKIINKEGFPALLGRMKKKLAAKG